MRRFNWPLWLGFLLSVVTFFQLLRCFCLVSGNARLPVGQLAAVFSGGSVAVSRVTSRVRQRSAARESFGSYCYDFGRRCYRVFPFRILCWWETVAGFNRCAASRTKGAELYAHRRRRESCFTKPTIIDAN